MKANELAKLLMEHPDWEVEAEGVSWVGCSEPERYSAEAELIELIRQSVFLIVAG